MLVCARYSGEGLPEEAVLFVIAVTDGVQAGRLFGEWTG
jgi:hypothetical protein